MSNYYLAPCLHILRNEVDKAHPNRDRRSDGWLGDTRHSALESDHNPDYPDNGVVRAFDVDKDGVDMVALLKAAIAHPSTQYVIWNGYIYSRLYKFKKRVYTGKNKHTSHMHISIRHGRSYENSTRSWKYAPTVKPYYGNCVKLQKAVRVPADNYWGEETEKACNAVRWAIQKKFPYGVSYAQKVVGVKQDNAWGGVSRRALRETIYEMERALVEMSHTSFTIDGTWNTQTESAYQKVRKICKRP